MNFLMIRFVLGRIIFVIGLLMLPSIAVALGYGEAWAGIWPFLLPMLLSLGIGGLMARKRPQQADFFMREGFVIVGLSWFILSILGCLPFYLSGSIPSFLDAFFESASGFTTTGASILTQPELLSHSQLFWRSFTHLIGGMGVLVFALAVMPRIESDDVFIMKAEVPGPIFGKLRARVRSTARVLYAMYLCMTLLLTVLLLFGGMPLFDSLLHAFGTAGTGGFGLQSSSVAYYNSAYIDYVISFGMLAFGLNFNLYYALLGRQFKDFIKNEELRWYLGIVTGAFIIIMLNTYRQYDSFARQIREVLFTVSSIITTTGFTICDYGNWPLLSHVVLLGLMFIGGMAGSTAGGLKISRCAIYVKSSFQELRGSLSPNRRLPLRFEGKELSAGLRTQVSHYLNLYILVFSALLLICAITKPNFVAAFSAVAATFNNIGPGLDVVGPAGSYAGLSALSKISLSIGMIMGRLEIIPVLVLFSPKTWRRT